MCSLNTTTTFCIQAMQTLASPHHTPLLPPLHSPLQHMWPFRLPLAPTALTHHVSASGTLPSLMPTGPSASAALWT